MSTEKEEKNQKQINAPVSISRKKYKKVLFIGLAVMAAAALISLVLGKSGMTLGWIMFALLYYFALTKMQEGYGNVTAGKDEKLRFPGYIRNDFFYTLEDELKILGFTNVKSVELNDVRLGIVAKKGIISRVVIDGKAVKNPGWYLPDTPIIIEYHGTGVE